MHVGHKPLPPPLGLSGIKRAGKLSGFGSGLKFLRVTEKPEQIHTRASSLRTLAIRRLIRSTPHGQGHDLGRIESLALHHSTYNRWLRQSDGAAGAGGLIEETRVASDPVYSSKSSLGEGDLLLTQKDEQHFVYMSRSSSGSPTQPNTKNHPN